MRHLFFLLALLSCFTAYTQTFTVGSTCCNYNLVNVTFTSTTGPFTSYLNTYTIDIDGDLVSDIDINSGGYSSGSAQFPSSKQISITSSTTCEFVYGPSGSSCWYSDLIDNIAIGTPLNSSLNWSLTPASSGNTGLPAPIINYYWYKPTAIAINCGQSINPFYVGFRKVFGSNDSIYGWIKMDSNFPGKVIDYAYSCGTSTATPPSSTLTTPSTVICKGDSVLLSASPGGGIFYGSGVTGNYFKSKNLTAGTHTVHYTLTDPNACTLNPSSVVFTVNPLPSIAFTNPGSACYGQTISLNANPVGGSFSGAGVSGNLFNSSLANIGNNAVFYSYTDINGCKNKASMNIVVANLSVTASAYPDSICLGFGSGTNLFAYGAYSYTWSTGAPGLSYTSAYPTVATTYSVVGQSYNCFDTVFVTVQVKTQHLIITAVPSKSLLCLGDTMTLRLSGSNSYTVSGGSSFYYTNTSTVVVQPTLIPSIAQPIWGDSIINGCRAYGAFSYNIVNLPVVGFAWQPYKTCASDSTFILSGFPWGGVYSGASVTGNVFYPSAVGIGTHTVSYSYTDPNGCFNSDVANITVGACVGINEIGNLNSQITIYPNPANDKVSISIDDFNNFNEYRFKLISIDGKEVKSVEITHSKTEISLSDLSNGIYFVEIGVKESTLRKKLIIVR